MLFREYYQFYGSVFYCETAKYWELLKTVMLQNDSIKVLFEES